MMTLDDLRSVEINIRYVLRVCIYARTSSISGTKGRSALLPEKAAMYSPAYGLIPSIPSRL